VGWFRTGHKRTVERQPCDSRKSLVERRKGGSSYKVLVAESQGPEKYSLETWEPEMHQESCSFACRNFDRSPWTEIERLSVRGTHVMFEAVAVDISNQALHRRLAGRRQIRLAARPADFSGAHFPLGPLGYSFRSLWLELGSVPETGEPSSRGADAVGSNAGWMHDARSEMHGPSGEQRLCIQRKQRIQLRGLRRLDEIPGDLPGQVTGHEPLSLLTVLDSNKEAISRRRHGCIRGLKTCR
jgi:hypothetical protein